MDMEALMRAADQALYRSKEAGRNRFTMAATRRTGTEAYPPLALVHDAAAEAVPPTAGTSWAAAPDTRRDLSA